MAEGELVTIAHQDDMYHRDYSARLLAAHRRYPDMTVFTTDYVIVKQGALITGDAMLWIKRILRDAPAVSADERQGLGKEAGLCPGQPHMLSGHHLSQGGAG